MDKNKTITLDRGFLIVAPIILAFIILGGLFLSIASFGWYSGMKDEAAVQQYQIRYKIQPNKQVSYTAIHNVNFYGFEYLDKWCILIKGSDETSDFWIEIPKDKTPEKP